MFTNTIHFFSSCELLRQPHENVWVISCTSWKTPLKSVTTQNTNYYLIPQVTASKHVITEPHWLIRSQIMLISKQNEVFAALRHEFAIHWERETLDRSPQQMGLDSRNRTNPWPLLHDGKNSSIPILRRWSAAGVLSTTTATLTALLQRAARPASCLPGSQSAVHTHSQANLPGWGKKAPKLKAILPSCEKRR